MATVDNIKLARYLRIVHFKFMILKKLYDRCVELARHKFSKPLLGFVAFIESFFFQAEDGIRDTDRSRGLGDVYKRQTLGKNYIEDDG